MFDIAAWWSSVISSTAPTGLQFTPSDDALAEHVIRGPQHAIQMILARQLAELVDVLAVLVDPDGNILYSNESAAVLIGRSDDPDDLPVASWLQQPCASALRQGRPTHTRVALASVDGRPRTMALTVLPLSGATRDSCGAMALLWEEE